MPLEEQIEKIKNMSPGHRRELVDEIKSPSVPAYIRAQETDLLLRLGDAETMRSQIEVLMGSNEDDCREAFVSLRACREPQAVAALCKFSLLEDVPHLQILVRLALFDMIPATLGFDSEIYDWIQRVKKDYFSSGTIIFGEWWEFNKDAFEKADYKAVKPWPLELLDAYGTTRNANGNPMWKSDGGGTTNVHTP